MITSVHKLRINTLLSLLYHLTQKQNVILKKKYKPKHTENLSNYTNPKTSLQTNKLVKISSGEHLCTTLKFIYYYFVFCASQKINF